MRNGKTTSVLRYHLQTLIRQKESTEESERRVAEALDSLGHGEAKALAVKAQLSQAFLSDLRHGRRTLALETAKRILEALQ